MCSQAQRFSCCSFRHAIHFKEDAASFYHSNKVRQGTTTTTHTNLSRLGSARLVRENARPNLTTTGKQASHCTAGGLKLIGFDPR